MRPKTHNPYPPKILLIILTISSFFLFIIRSNLPSSHSSIPSPSCSSHKIPTSVSQAVIHYAASTNQPQQTLQEIQLTSQILDNKSPCNFLVFGLGHDSLMWHVLNNGGSTIFLEEDRAWIAQIKKKFPSLNVHHVIYETKVSQASELMQAGKGHECTGVMDPRYSMCQLALRGLPREIYDVEWDMVLVDGPTGSHGEAPGRMAAIYTVGMMARNRRDGHAETDVLVHDVNREIEDEFSKEFLCEWYMKGQEGRLRHFVVPSHRNDLDKPFCPLSGFS